MVSKYLTHKKNNQIVSEMMKMEKWLRASDRWKESKRVKTTRESKRVKTTRERESSDNGNGLLHDNTQNSTTTPASLWPSVALSLLLCFSLSSNTSLCFLITSLLTFPFTMFAPGTESGREQSDEGKPCEHIKKDLPSASFLLTMHWN